MNKRDRINLIRAAYDFARRTEGVAWSKDHAANELARQAGIPIEDARRLVEDWFTGGRPPTLFT